MPIASGAWSIFADWVQRVEEAPKLDGAGARSEQVASAWFDKQMNLRPASRSRYEISLRCHLIPEFGTLPISELDEERIAEFIAAMGQAAYAAWTIRSALTRRWPFPLARRSLNAGSAISPGDATRQRSLKGSAELQAALQRWRRLRTIRLWSLRSRLMGLQATGVHVKRAVASRGSVGCRRVDARARSTRLRQATPASAGPAASTSARSAAEAGRSAPGRRSSTSSSHRSRAASGGSGAGSRSARRP